MLTIAFREFVCNRLGTISGWMGTIRCQGIYSTAEAVKT